MAQDIAVPVGDYFFNFRVAAIIQREGSVLINRLVGQDFWFLPGGRVQAGEATPVAIAREIREELLVACDVVRSVFLHETFFCMVKNSFTKYACTMKLLWRQKMLRRSRVSLPPTVA